LLGFTPSMMEDVLALPDMIVSPRDVSINTTAIMVVTFVKKDMAPVLPNTAWLEPPNAAPMSAPFPF